MSKDQKDEAVRESFLVAGFSAFVAGVWWIYPPAALIIGGGLLMWLGLPRRRSG
ncbi:hypothetical protein ACFSR7_36195 [Cohnella sp. GCM10020058]|uniref:hypothetical protein n=1 Tax=Cohnella sp. GCM10020058 TaxID=3317330 RepID=UPI003638FCB4